MQSFCEPICILKERHAILYFRSPRSIDEDSIQRYLDTLQGTVKGYCDRSTECYMPTSIVTQSTPNKKEKATELN